jgi:hypothetical protein
MKWMHYFYASQLVTAIVSERMCTNTYPGLQTLHAALKTWSLVRSPEPPGSVDQGYIAFPLCHTHEIQQNYLWGEPL